MVEGQEHENAIFHELKSTILLFRLCTSIHLILINFQSKITVNKYKTKCNSYLVLFYK